MNKWEFEYENPQQRKFDKYIPNKQSPENQSKSQEKNGHRKTKKDTKKWCDFHKIPWHNTDECHSKQSLVVEIKENELNPDSESVQKIMEVLELGKETKNILSLNFSVSQINKSIIDLNKTQNRNVK